MASAPWLTVVTVVKDDEGGLARTAHSLTNQDLAGVEYLVVDSSSDDSRAPAILAGAQLTGSAHITWTPPRGIYAAMNTGLAAARGDYVIFINAGDELLDGAIGDISRCVSQTHPEWLYADVEIIGSDGTCVVTPPWDVEIERHHAFARGRFPAHQGTVVRTDLLRRIGGFDTAFRIAADYDAFLALVQASPPQHLKSTVARFHEGGASSVNWARSVREFHRARRIRLDLSGGAALRERLATARQFAALAAHRSPWPLSIGLALVAVAVMGLTGVAWVSAGLLVAAVALQGLGGALWWRMLRPSRAVPVLEAVGMGLGLGTAAAMLIGLVSAWWLAPLAAVVAWLGRRRWRGAGAPVAALAPLQRPDAIALVVGLIPGLGALVLVLRNYPLAWSGLWAGYHGDMPFFEAVAASVARLGPGASIFMSGADLRYHALAYGWAGQLTLAFNAEPFVVLTRLLPLAMLIAAIAIAATWTRQLVRVWWAPSLAVALIVTGGFVGATYGGVLNFDSPSQAVTSVWLLALCVVIIQATLSVSLPWHLLAVAVLIVAVTGGKVSTSVIAGFAIVTLAVVGLARRAPWRGRALAVAVMAAVAFTATYLWLLSGSANAGGLGLFSLLDRASSVQGLAPVITPRGIIAGIAILIAAVAARWAGLAWLIGDRQTRWQPATAVGLGLAVGGIATLAFLSGGFNDLWFAVAASAPLSVLSAAGVARAAMWLGPAARTRIIWAGALGLLGAGATGAIWASGSTGIIGQGWRWSAPLVGWLIAIISGVILGGFASSGRTRRMVAFGLIAIVVMAVPARLVFAAAEPAARDQSGRWSSELFSDQADFVPILDDDRSVGWTDGQAAAGAWLRSNAGGDDIVATNVTGGALVPALTRLPTYLSDIRLQTPYGRDSQVAEAQQREAQSWAFIDEPTARSIAPLCEAGVTWVWVDPRKTTTRDWAPFGQTVREGKDATILRLAPSVCG